MCKGYQEHLMSLLNKPKQSRLKFLKAVVSHKTIDNNLTPTFSVIIGAILTNRRPQSLGWSCILEHRWFSYLYLAQWTLCHCISICDHWGQLEEQDGEHWRGMWPIPSQHEGSSREEKTKIMFIFPYVFYRINKRYLWYCFKRQSKEWQNTALTLQLQSETMKLTVLWNKVH